MLSLALSLSLSLGGSPQVRQVQDKLPDFTNRERCVMLKTIDDLAKSIGSCERLVQTPVPLSYARHTSRFLSLWCLTLPLVRVSSHYLYNCNCTATTTSTRYRYHYPLLILLRMLNTHTTKYSPLPSSARSSRCSSAR